MRKNDRFYLHLLAQCQSADLQHRLDALEDLCKHEYLDLIEAQFLKQVPSRSVHFQDGRHNKHTYIDLFMTN